MKIEITDSAAYGRTWVFSENEYEWQRSQTGHEGEEFKGIFQPKSANFYVGMASKFFIFEKDIDSIPLNEVRAELQNRICIVREWVLQKTSAEKIEFEL